VTGSAAASNVPPKVSVVITCHNLGRYLDEAVDSVLAQSFQDFEIVIVDDGSTDEATVALLQKYDRPRTRVVMTGNQGLARARNLGISLARGQFVTALDADDAFEPGYLEKAVKILDEQEGIAFVSMWLETFGDEHWVWRQDRCDLPALLAECTVCTAALVRASALAAAGGYDDRMPVQGYEDWDLWIGLAERGYRGLIIPEVLFRYRRRAGSMSSICCAEPAHGELMQYLIHKHRESYDRHSREVVLFKESEAGALLRTNHALERHLKRWLEPQVASRRKELERLRQKLQRVRDERRAQAERDSLQSRLDDLERSLILEKDRVVALSAELMRATGEVSALRTSRSWKITAPLRAAQDFLMRFTKGSR
jgi:GT2 family glycosyltransferase